MTDNSIGSPDAATTSSTSRAKIRKRVSPIVGGALTLSLIVSPLAFSATAGANDIGMAARAVTRAQSTGWSSPVTLFKATGAVIDGVSCASSELCIAVGAKGANGIALSGAKTWSSVASYQSGSFTSVSCLTDGNCEAVGEGTSGGTLRGVTYHRLNGKWSAGPNTKFPLASLSCGSTSFCAGVDNLLPQGHGFVFNGKTWSSPASLAVSPFSISCTTAHFCAAVSQSGKVLYYQNGAWSKATSIDPTGVLDSISCTSASFCVAVGGNGDALVDESGKWSKPDSADGNGLNAVSCATTKFCMAVDSYGGVVSYNGTGWSSTNSVSAEVDFKSVSCPTTTFCAAVGSNGSSTDVYALTYKP